MSSVRFSVVSRDVTKCLQVFKGVYRCHEVPSGFQWCLEMSRSAFRFSGESTDVKRPFFRFSVEARDDQKCLQVSVASKDAQRCLEVS